MADPKFVAEIKEQYLQGRSNLFLLHGNTTDLQLAEEGEQRLRDFLVDKLFTKRDIILFFNPGSGIKFYNQESRTAFMQLVRGHDALSGTNYFNQLPSDYGQIMKLLDRFIRVHGSKQSIALVIEYAQLLFPADELSALDNSDVSSIVTALEWTRSSEVTKGNITVCLIAENISEVHSMLTRSEQVSKVYVDFPDEDDRKKIISRYSKQYQVKLPQTQKSLVQLTTGFTNEGLIKLFAASEKEGLDLEQIKQFKKDLITARTLGLVELIETERTLDDVAGHVLAKKRLTADAKLMQQGKLDVMPMGYLIAGPIGTGKSYLAECFAGEIGIPAIKLKNFRERWVGATEANWERILNAIKSLAPILVIVDEADAALGNREQDGDSGTQQRVFAKLAETMGDTKNRGKVLWMLLTARPELLPVDLKRQGRAEVHIPLLYPKTIEEKVEFFAAIARKVDFSVKPYLELLKKMDLSEIRSGADIESILVKCKRLATVNKKQLTNSEFEEIVAAFRSSLDPEQINKQIEAALAEVTDMDLLESGN